VSRKETMQLKLKLWITMVFCLQTNSRKQAQGRSLEQALDTQFASRRLLAKITSQPGQTGRCCLWCINVGGTWTSHLPKATSQEINNTIIDQVNFVVFVIVSWCRLPCRITPQSILLLQNGTSRLIYLYTASNYKIHAFAIHINKFLYNIAMYLLAI